MEATLPAIPARGHAHGLVRFVRRNPTLAIGAVLLGLVVLIAFFAPLLAGDPLFMTPSDRLAPPNGRYLLGTDSYGRDVYARTIFGSRVSLTVGISVATFSVLVGLTLGLVAGYVRSADPAIMRVMDGLMAIPTMLLAIALVSLTRASVSTVILAITVPEIPRVVRLVRAVVLTVAEQPYVEAALAGGASTFRIIMRHILPSTVAPMIVQASYICASAILIEAALSFLGAGSPPDIPSWGNMIASSRMYLSTSPLTVFAPGLSLALTVLAVNLIGDGLRDRLDPRLARRM
ncbi:MAG TPA: ABC transporter permease [Burkholderiaceae bacterium]|nr:ABC transporter permease [Burkholderiaceae bacterium]